MESLLKIIDRVAQIAKAVVAGAAVAPAAIAAAGADGVINGLEWAVIAGAVAAAATAVWAVPNRSDV